MTVLDTRFFARDTLTVARELLGQRLVRRVNGQRLSGVIVETEAYVGPHDTACHAHAGRTRRTEVMFGPPGRTYVYLIYGMYHMLNLVTERVDYPAAVLVRAIEPEEGLDTMRTLRQKPGAAPMKLTNLTSGPGKLCRALAIERQLNNWPLGSGEQLWLEPGAPVPEAAVAAGPRIGIKYASAKDRAAPWRFWVRANKFVSRR